MICDIFLQRLNTYIELYRHKCIYLKRQVKYLYSIQSEGAVNLFIWCVGLEWGKICINKISISDEMKLPVLFLTGLVETHERTHLVHLSDSLGIYFSPLYYPKNTNLQIICTGSECREMCKGLILEPQIPLRSSNIQFTIAKQRCEPFHNPCIQSTSSNESHVKSVNSERIYLENLFYFTTQCLSKLNVLKSLA